MQEKTIESKKCRLCNTSFDITNLDLQFYEKVSPVFKTTLNSFSTQTKTPLNSPLISGDEATNCSSSSPDKGRLGGVLDLWNWKVKYLIPTPTLCPECRFQNRHSFINERHLYKRKCDATWKDIISNYSPDKPYKVYDSEVWLDSRDFDKYGRDFDFSRPFFEQYNELFLEVPRMSLDQWANIETSSFNNYVDDLKDCYMCFNGVWSQSCYHDSYVFNSKDCVDCLISHQNSQSYELVSCKKCYNLYFSQNCNECSDSYFLKDCISCKDCIYCVNQVWKQYCIFNKQYGKEEYQEKRKDFIEELNIDINKCKNKFEEFKANNFVKNLNITNCENCRWDDISNSKNLKNCFLASDAENVAYSFNAVESVNCYDCDWFWIEKSYYNLVTWWKSQNCLFCIAGWENCSNMIYCDYCFFACSNLFWCIWLKNKSYCILNKQYTKQEYEELVPKIIEHMMKPLPTRLRGIEGESYMESEWWEFFPSNISPFWYNETVAMEYFPLTPPLTPPCEGGGLEQVPPLTRGRLGGGFNWSTYEPPFPKVQKIIPANKLPYDIKQIPDDILNWAIECEITKKPFRIIKQELEFYRRKNLPIPKRHPDQRHLDRMNLRNPMKLFDRKCDKCKIDIKTTYSPNRPEKVYCDTCYSLEIY